MSPKVQPSKLLVYIASSFAIVLWGMSYIWTDRLIELNIPVFYFVFVRILMAGIVLFLGDMPGGNGLQFALQQLHTALAAGAVAGTGGIDGHIGPTGQLQQIVTGVALDADAFGAFDLKQDFAHMHSP